MSNASNAVQVEVEEVVVVEVKDTTQLQEYAAKQMEANQDKATKRKVLSSLVSASNLDKKKAEIYVEVLAYLKGEGVSWKAITNHIRTMYIEDKKWPSACGTPIDNLKVALTYGQYDGPLALNRFNAWRSASYKDYDVAKPSRKEVLAAQRHKEAHLHNKENSKKVEILADGGKVEKKVANIKGGLSGSDYVEANREEVGERAERVANPTQSPFSVPGLTPDMAFQCLAKVATDTGNEEAIAALAMLKEALGW